MIALLYGAKLPAGRELWLTALFGLIALGGGNGTLVFAEQWIPSGIAALFVTTSPFWMVGIESLRSVTATSSGRRRIIGIGVGFLGILVLVGPAALGAGLGPRSDQRISSCCNSALSAGASGPFCRRTSQQRRIRSSAERIQQFATGLSVLPFVCLTPSPRELEQSRYLGGCLSGVFGSIVGYSAFIYAMEHLPVSVFRRMRT